MEESITIDYYHSTKLISPSPANKDINERMIIMLRTSCNSISVMALLGSASIVLVSRDIRARRTLIQRTVVLFYITGNFLGESDHISILSCDHL